MHKSHFILIYCLLVYSGLAFSSDSGFPGRALYPDVDVISTQELNDLYNDVVIVDVRSKFEFETLHLIGAKHIPLGANLGRNVKKIRKSDPDKLIVMYCNGRTCHKSYKAVRLAGKYDVKNIVSYDSGVLEFAQANPDKAVLLGETPINVSSIITKSQFNNKIVTPEIFSELTTKQGVTVIDIRDPRQRDGISLFYGREERASLDDKSAIKQVLSKIIDNGNVLLAYDQAGKQVRWFMYQLEKAGIKQYMFMEGGANTYFKEMREDYFKD